MKKTSRGQLRIIAGLWRGRKLSFEDEPALRPTPDRVRETLFNWLQTEITGSRCLDLFAGSGALGFEAASRGASEVVMLDSSPAIVKILQDNVHMLDAGQIKINFGDAVGFLNNTGVVFDIVFVDPPYQTDLAGTCCQLLERQQCLSKHAKIYVESDSNRELSDVPENWRCLKSKKAGQVGYHLFIREEN